MEMEWIIQSYIKAFCEYFYKQSINNKIFNRMYLGYIQILCHFV